MQTESIGFSSQIQGLTEKKRALLCKIDLKVSFFLSLPFPPKALLNGFLHRIRYVLTFFWWMSKRIFHKLALPCTLVGLSVILAWECSTCYNVPKTHIHESVWQCKTRGHYAWVVPINRSGFSRGISLIWLLFILQRICFPIGRRLCFRLEKKQSFPIFDTSFPRNVNKAFN